MSGAVVLVTGSYDRDIRFWEAWSGICSRTITRSGETGQVNKLAISPDKRLLAAAIWKKVYVYDIASQASSPIFIFEGHSLNVTSLCFHMDGKWLVSASEDGTIRIWDLQTNSLHRSYNNTSAINDICVHPNQGELISADQAGSIKQWDLTEDSCTHELTPAGDIPIRSVSLTTDGHYLVAGNNKGKCYLWRVSEETKTTPRFSALTKWQAHATYITKVLMSPDGKFLATCSADKAANLKIWSISLGQPQLEIRMEKMLQGHQRWVWDCAFSADSAYLVTASSDHTARLWEMASGETVRQYSGHYKAAVCCALHDGAG